MGRPVPGVDLRLAADGEVLLRGAGVMAGYRGEPEIKLRRKPIAERYADVIEALYAKTGAP